MTKETAAVEALETRLDSFNPDLRREALLELKGMADKGQIELPSSKPEVNVHFHTFYSFNSHNWSPSRVAWEARKYGLEVAGKVDFDVLEGMEEFLEAGDILGLKTSVGLESRVFIQELADKVINSPGEPGVAYFMAVGCTRRPQPESHAERVLYGLYQTARGRNVGLMDRVNAYLETVTLDYEADVLPLTPAGNATERHLLAAYDEAARKVFPNPTDLAAFWAGKLNLPADQAEALVSDSVKLQETMRSKLMKQGGVAYVQPESGSFPTIESVVDLARSTGAIPCMAWLDGTYPGEEDSEALVELMVSKGVAAANIIPDRNFNIKDPEEKKLKVRKLDEFIQSCRKHGLPILVGTEMNKLGLPYVDQFNAPELKGYLQDFLDGAHFIWGHTLLERYASMGYFSPQVEDAFGNAHLRKNKFFTLIGRLPVPDAEKREHLTGIHLDPENLLTWMKS